MSVYTTPGVYRVPVKPAVASGLAVGVPAFLGYPASAAPIGEAQPLRQWSEYVVTFGDPRLGVEAPGSYLAAAVRGFFENGGPLCYVVPLAGPSVDADPDDILADGLGTLDLVEDVDLVAVPDLVRLIQPLVASQPLEQVQPPAAGDIARLQQVVIDSCERNGGRFALLDPPAHTDVDNLLSPYRNQLRGTNAALYYPWILVRNQVSGSVRTVPPCGHVAGVYAATDRRVGVFKAPANVELQGVVDLARALSDSDQDLLNPAGVNALRAFPGRGIRIWGARTLSGDPLWRYVSVRRLFTTAARWLERNLASMAFEPHDTRLWTRIARELTSYFNGLYQAGALKGATAAEAFFVKCDAETNPPDVRDAGRVVTEIGLAPAIPNEFVVIRISVTTSGVTIEGPG